MLNDEKLLKRFCIPYYDVLDGEPPSPTWGEADAQNYAMTMVCMPQSFENGDFRISFIPRWILI